MVSGAIHISPLLGGKDCILGWHCCTTVCGILCCAGVTHKISDLYLFGRSGAVCVN